DFRRRLLVDHALFGFFFRDHFQRRFIDRVFFVIYLEGREFFRLFDVEPAFDFRRRRVLIAFMFRVVAFGLFAMRNFVVMFFPAFRALGHIGFVFGGEFFFR